MCEKNFIEASVEPADYATLGVDSSSRFSELPVTAPSLSLKKGENEHRLPSLWTPLYKVVQMSPRETPRFEEMSARSNTEGGDFQTPRAGANSARGDGMQDHIEATEISYEGEKMDGMKHGAGRLRSKGMTYVGDFQEDQKHGVGTITWDDGRKYEGHFEDDSFHGSATMAWPDGRKYIGQYVMGKKNGSGCFSWPDGRKYTGQWIAGKRHGIGVYTNAKGFTRKSLWQMDRPVRWDTSDPKGSTNLLGTPHTAESHELQNISHVAESDQSFEV
jgi:hypothetical protein